MGYILTPENDSTAVFDKETGKMSHLCDLPGHYHLVEFPYADCYERYWDQVSPEERARLKREIEENIRKHLNRNSAIN